ncbi:nucleotidyltransferase domain-containing protein [Halomarina halobia]
MRDYLAQTAVEFAHLFGSRIRGTAEESSDVDVALRLPGANRRASDSGSVTASMLNSSSTPSTP